MSFLIDMKTVEINIDINSAMSVCVRAGVIIYPIKKGDKFGVEVNDNELVITGRKEYGTKEIANACNKAYKYYAKKLIRKQNANA